jgi:hypothetical protein
VTVLATAGLVEKPGDRIGRYKLLEQFGEGGFGIVWIIGEPTLCPGDFHRGRTTFGCPGASPACK